MPSPIARSHVRSERSMAAILGSPTVPSNNWAGLHSTTGPAARQVPLRDVYDRIQETRNAVSPPPTAHAAQEVRRSLAWRSSLSVAATQRLLAKRGSFEAPSLRSDSARVGARPSAPASSDNSDSPSRDKCLTARAVLSPGLQIVTTDKGMVETTKCDSSHRAPGTAIRDSRISGLVLEQSRV